MNKVCRVCLVSFLAGGIALAVAPTPPVRQRALLTSLSGVTSEKAGKLSARLRDLGIVSASFESDFALDKLSHVLDTLAEVRKRFTPSPVEIFPSALSVKFASRLYGGGSYGADRLEIGFQVELNDGTLLPPEVSRAAIAHEYGHAIFDVLMERVNPTYRAHVESKRRILEIRERIEALAARDSEDPQIDSLIKKSKQIAANRTPEVDVIYDLFFPYNELFADVVGVLFASSGRAIADVVEDDKRIRDFTANPSIREWKRVDPYGALAPARWELGRSYGLASGKTSNPSSLLRRLIAAIDQEYREALSKPDYRLTEGNVLEANERLMRAFAAQR